jgi:hypothetical protein
MPEERPMPTYDGRHYFLTALIPVRTDVVPDGTTVTSPVHALRKRLAMLPTAQQTPACKSRQSPFALNTSNHFVRLVVIDDVAYNGRQTRDTLVTAALRDTLTDAQPQDHLSCPFLLLAVDFDAESGADQERDSYLATLWRTMEKELREIFTFCQGFDARVRDAATFAAYIAAAQLETTMSFNDYYIDPLNLPSWPADAYLRAAKASGFATALGVLATLVILATELFTSALHLWLRYAVGLTGLGVLALVIVAVWAYVTVMAAGAKPFRKAPDSDLPTVLKALHLRGAFTRFAIDHQALAASNDPVAAKKLRDDFAAFVKANVPDKQLEKPTQSPGVIGI